MSYKAFIDTCVFIAYGTEFEEFHPACTTFFEETDCEKYTSKSVEKELILKLKKRDKLYKDYSKYLARKDTGADEKYKVSSDIHLNNNDLRHLNDLIQHLSTTPAHHQLTFLRQFGKRLKHRINRALKSLEEIIPRNNDAYFKDIIRSVIINNADSWILNDAIHWSLNNNKAVFVTLDGEIYYNRDKLMQTVTDHKFLDKPPLQIIHGKHFDKNLSQKHS